MALIGRLGVCVCVWGFVIPLIACLSFILFVSLCEFRALAEKENRSDGSVEVCRVNGISAIYALATPSLRLTLSFMAIIRILRRLDAYSRPEEHITRQTQSGAVGN